MIVLPGLIDSDSEFLRDRLGRAQQHCATIDNEPDSPNASSLHPEAPGIAILIVAWHPCYCFMHLQAYRSHPTMQAVTFVSLHAPHRGSLIKPSWPFSARSRRNVHHRVPSASQRKRLYVRLTYEASNSKNNGTGDLCLRERTSQPVLFSLALLASTIGSLIGAGGGVVLTPLLSALGLSQHKAHGTTLVVITATALISATKYALAARISIPVACILSAAAIFTSPIGARYSAKLNGPALKRYFGAVLIVVSIMIPLLPHLSMIAMPSMPLLLQVLLLSAIGTLTGFLNGLLGIGGGTINVPVLVLLSFPQKVAQGTALLAMVPPSIRAALVHRKLGHVVAPILPALIFGAIAGGYFGSSTAIVLPDNFLRLVCSTCFAVIGIRYLSRKPKTS